MFKNKYLGAGYKLVFGLLGLSAVVTEIIILVGRGRFVPENFFSYFTIESNIFAAIILLVGAGFLLSKKLTPGWFEFLRGAAALYMITTGAVFSVLLANLDPSALTALPWDNTVLHYIIPIAMALDWFFDPPRKRIAFKRAMIWFVYPLAYVAYTMIRGALTGWYPYPFLDPTIDGYGKVAIIAIGITITVVVFTGVLLGVQRLLRRGSNAARNKN